MLSHGERVERGNSREHINTYVNLRDEAIDRPLKNRAIAIETHPGRWTPIAIANYCIRISDSASALDHASSIDRAIERLNEMRENNFELLGIKIIQRLKSRKRGTLIISP